MHRCRRRDGSALLIAVALLALAGALLGGSMASARSAARAAKSHEAAFIADAESRVVLASVVQGWSAIDDSLAVGAGHDATVGPRLAGSTGAVVVTRIRVQRLSAGRYVVATDCQVGPDSAVLARRRMQLLLERVAAPDTTGSVTSPAPIGRWSLSDLFL